MSDKRANPTAPPHARRNPWPWLLPLAALIAAAVLGYQALAQRGPTVHIEFVSGEGLGVGDPVVFRGVRVGEVSRVELAPGLATVRVAARLRRDAAGLAVAGSQFWIVRPEISAGRVQGLDALLGPRYIECAPGGGAKARSFTGLPTAPGKTIPGVGALTLIIEAADRSSLAVDSPVTYRGIRVGAVRAVALAPDARTVEVTAAIDPAYRHLVRSNSRFWNAGGIGVDWGMGGVSFKTPSLETAISGGIAFATPTKPGDPAQDNARFTLSEKPESDWLKWNPELLPQ